MVSLLVHRPGPPPHYRIRHRNIVLLLILHPAGEPIDGLILRCRLMSQQWSRPPGTWISKNLLPGEFVLACGVPLAYILVTPPLLFKARQRCLRSNWRNIYSLAKSSYGFLKPAVLVYWPAMPARPTPPSPPLFKTAKAPNGRLGPTTTRYKGWR